MPGAQHDSQHKPGVRPREGAGAGELFTRFDGVAPAAGGARSVYTNYVGGDWRPSSEGRTYETRSPARPSDVVGAFAASAEADVDAAVSAAADAFPAWSRLPAVERAAVLVAAADAIESRREELALVMARETGKPLAEGRLEAARAAQILHFFAGEAWRPTGESYAPSTGAGRLYTMRRPLGVVGAITPWNFPAAIPVWKTAPALVFGNTVVLKPAEESALTAVLLAECFAESDVPAGVVNVVTGSGADVGGPLVRDERVRAVSFTGSVEAGGVVRDDGTRRGKRVQLELGGQNPLIVMPDAALQPAVEAAFAGAFSSAGQKCTATRRVFVHEEIYGEFRALLLERIRQAKIGDPADPSTEMGPIVSERQLSDILSAVEQGIREGATLVTGGHRLDGDGHFMAPTLFEDVPDDAVLSCREIFGPVTSLYRFATLDEALTRANAVDYGLCASIFTSDHRTVHRFLDEVQAGILKVNLQTTGADVHVPFGGTKASGWGPHEQGRAALEFYTELVTVYEN